MLPIIDLRLRLRTKFSLAFAVVPLAMAVPSYLFGEYFTLSPHDGYHRYADLYWMVLSSLINAPLLGLAAYTSWSLFGYRPENLFYKSFIGNAVFGFLLPLATILAVTYAGAFFLMGLSHLGAAPFDSPMIRQFVIMFLLIWGSWAFLAPAGGLLGLTFGRLKGLRTD